MANRSMDAKCKRAVSQRQLLGFNEGSKPAYSTNKPVLREIAANAQHMVRNVSRRTIAPRETVMVVYNPSIYRKPANLATKCMVACDGELVKRADYLRK